MKMLDVKLLRDLSRMKGQAVTIALVVASGIGGFIGMLTAYDSLHGSRQSYYESTRFADLFSGVKRAPESLAEPIVQLPGVSDAETTTLFDVTLDIPNVAEPVTGRMIGLTDGRPPRLNRLTLRRGRWIEPGERNEVLVSEGFATARGLQPGDRLAALLNGKREDLRIVGVALSPEYIYANRGGAFPDDKGFGIFWMERDGVEAAFNMKGAFNSVTLRLAPHARAPAVISALDRLLAPYGGLGAYGREDQISHRILDQELNQLKVNATVFPSIFLGVAAFLLNVVLARQISTQREQIAALKALGYADRTIALHYLKFVLVIVLAGIAGGIGIGVWLGHYMTGMYTTFFHFPQLTYRIQPWIPLLAAAISLTAGVAAALQTVRRVASLPPAEAMRPPAPATFRRMILERLGWAHLLSSQTRMVVRTLERRPLRAALTTFGIASSIAIIIGGTFWGDAVEELIRVQFDEIQREDADITFVEPLSEAVRYEIDEIPGVLYAEPSRSVPVRLRAGHRSYRTAVMGLPQEGELRQLLDADRHPIPLPPDGLLLTDRLAARLGVKPGDRIEVESLEGKRTRRTLLVAGLVNDLVGMVGYMEIGVLNRAMGEGNLISSVAVRVDRAGVDLFNARLKETPAVATVGMKRTALETFEKESARNIFFFTTIVTIFAGAIAVGVVYNSARIALAERAWELASLRVLGFTRGEVSALLLGELAAELILAIPFGLWLGYLLALGLVRSAHSENFIIPMVITPRTYAYAVLAILIAGVVSALIVRNRIDHLDLVGVLKTRE
ncbi:MAG: FtsX-like permease family protein [Candidatus Manganitrophaceae bacterium]|nr:MAG: FtsX-like permease family protein [Candidatus Manganitrophaceae bacterium]